MSKKDVIDIVLGCVAWSAALTVGVLMVYEILDFEVVIRFCLRIIFVLLAILFLLISLFFARSQLIR